MHVEAGFYDKTDTTDFDPLTMSKTGAIDNTRQNNFFSEKGMLHLRQRCKLQNLAHNLQPCGNLPCKEQQVGDVESNVSCSGYVIAFGHQRDHGTCSSPQSHNGCSSIQVRTREQLACSTSQQSINFSCHALDVLQLLIHTQCLSVCSVAKWQLECAVRICSTTANKTAMYLIADMC